MRPSLRLAAILAILPAAALAHDLAITDVAIADTRGGSLAPHRTVVLRDGRIASVGNSAPPDAMRVDGKGKFLIPGLWDMVTNLSWTGASALPALVANGVTAVRDEGGNLTEIAVWAAAITAGTLTGPTIFQVGPMLNGKSFNRFQYTLGSPAAARSAVRLLKFEGADGLEIERRVPRDVYFALMAEARMVGLPVGGKVPLEISPAEASNAGQSTIDNLETIYDGLFRAAHQADMAHAMDTFLKAVGEGDALFATLRRNATAVTPCVAIFAGAIRHQDPAAAPDPNTHYVAKSQRHSNTPVPAGELAAFALMQPRLMTTIARLQAAGVMLLAGTDIAGGSVPGFSLHDELDALSAAGLTPLQVLQAATLHPAIVLKRTNDYGTIEAGKIADLVMLDANPIENTRAVHRISGVILHGKFFDRAALNTLLRQSAQEAEAN